MTSSYETSNGRITSPGKFEAEAEYIPHMWEVSGISGEMPTESGVYSVLVMQSDRDRFPALNGTDFVHMVEDEQGFVSEVSIS